MTISTPKVTLPAQRAGLTLSADHRGPVLASVDTPVQGMPRRLWVVTALCLAVLVSCGDDPKANTAPAARLLTEHDFSTNPSLSLAAGDVLQTWLESSAAHPGDSHGVGTDRFPMRLDARTSFDLCFSDDDGEAHLLRILSGEEERARQVADAPCTAVTLEAGDYTLELQHATPAVEDPAQDVIFFRLHPANTPWTDPKPELPTTEGEQGGPSTTGPLSSSSTPCDDTTSMPGKGVAWLYYDDNCQGDPLVLDTDAVVYKMINNPGSFPPLTFKFPRSIKVGPDTSVFLFNAGDYSYSDGWYVIWTGSSAASRRQVSSYVYDKAVTSRVFTPRVLYQDNVTSLLAEGEYALFPYGGTKGWRLSAGVQVARVVTLSQMYLSGLSVPFFQLSLGPYTGLLHQDPYGNDRQIRNDTPSSQVMPFTQANQVSGLTKSVWGLRDADKQLANAVFLATTNSCRYCNLSGLILHNNNLSSLDLSHANLSSADLSQANLSSATLKGTSLAHTNLIQASFTHANLTGANLYKATLEGTDFSHATMDQAKLHGATCSPSSPCQVTFAGASLKGAELEGVFLTDSSLAGADLSDAHLGGGQVKTGDDWHNAGTESLVAATCMSCDLSAARLDRALLGKAAFSSSDLTCASLRDLDASAAGFDGISFSRPDNKLACRLDFSGSTVSAAVVPAVDLRYLNFTRATFTDLNEVKLAKVDFTRAMMSQVALEKLDLHGTTWDEADLVKTSFNRSVLTAARLHQANARSARFAFCDLERADFAQAVLSYDPGDKSSGGADFSKAFMKDVKLSNADLTRAVLTGASLYGTAVSLDGTNFAQATFIDAYLGGLSFVDPLGAVTLNGADFTGAILVGADLSGADLTLQDHTSGSLQRALLHGAQLKNTNLKGVSLLDALASLSTGEVVTQRLFRNPADGVIAYEKRKEAYDSATERGGTQTDSSSTCPDGLSGPCTADERWIPDDPKIIDQSTPPPAW